MTTKNTRDLFVRLSLGHVMECIEHLNIVLRQQCHHKQRVCWYMILALFCVSLIKCHVFMSSLSSLLGWKGVLLGCVNRWTLYRKLWVNFGDDYHYEYWFNLIFGWIWLKTNSRTFTIRCMSQNQNQQHSEITRISLCMYWFPPNHESYVHDRLM